MCSVRKIGRITPGRQECYSQRASTGNRAGYEVVSSVIFSMINLKEIDLNGMGDKGQTQATDTIVI
jgi:hypothetical protein